MDNDADVFVDADRPEVGVFDAIDFMEPQPRASRIKLQVKSGSLGGFLFLSGQLGEAVGEGVRDAEFHDSSGNVKVQSKWTHGSQREPESPLCSLGTFRFPEVFHSKKSTRLDSQRAIDHWE